METVTVSPGFRMVIPKKIRAALNIKAGDKLGAIAYGEHIVLVPLKPIDEMRGFVAGIDTSVEREPDRV